MPDLPEGRSNDQYFVVCVPESTPEDIQTRKDLKERDPKVLFYVLPTGPIVPRLIGCPEGSVFDSESGMCQ